jgi:hypothetical protein
MPGRAGNPSNLSVLPSPDGRLKEEAADLLEEAKSMGFQSVIIFGFNGEGIHVKHSSTKSRLEIIGALEAAKLELWLYE